MTILCNLSCNAAPQPSARPWIRALVLVALAALISSCSIKSQAPRTPVEIPARFSQSGQSTLPDQWWLSFGDSVLNSLMDQALANNFDLKTAWDRLRQAEALARSAGADLVPTLDVEAENSRNRYYEDGQTTEGHSYTLDLAASYEVDLWGRIRSSRDAAAFEAQASAQDLQAAALTLSAQVAGTWYQLIEQYGQLEILNAQITNNEKVLELVTLQVRTGQVGIADMLQQRQLVESNQGEKAQVLAETGVLEHQLAILLGQPPQQNVAPRVTALIDLPPMPQSGLPAQLIERRPDIRSAYYSVQAADSDLGAAIANRFPQLTLSADLNTTGVHTRDLFNNWLATLAANLVTPIVDGGLRKAEVDRTRAAASQALHTYGQTILDALKEVEDALVQEQRRREFITSIDKQLTLAGQVIQRVRDRYLQGTMDYQRVLDAQLSQQTLQRSLLTAKQALVQDRIDLCLALGSGWVLEQPEQNLSHASKQ
ncbi:putative outer membrane efflux protein (OprM-family protein) [Desulforapulum autotrophicum HRM2]|uniref:Outer membrane efflux protein (OprM-family protein) n=1 Tax=Desulforapulum autotrophicum (strain ATCC 43914 / DSM 3382 / VKM B-1955 / HRM2) TaxID=177437 RepID=C0QE98_DESAH|nr:efflux transporter outer membrane subunit [Desulforapulum autotrophicum]ACN13215.1 putative outer membrane efflux protein (OprM-family protein) [Desulforapulum autotrophicum HRM2]